MHTLGSFVSNAVNNASGPPGYSNRPAPSHSQGSIFSGSKSINAYVNLPRAGVHGQPATVVAQTKEPWQHPLPQVLQGSPNSPFHNRGGAGLAPGVDMAGFATSH